MNIKSHLLSGAGNTFHIFFEIDLNQLDKNFVKNLCAHYPADGVVFLKKTNSSDLYKWIFFNNNGSIAEMCGNATRCVGFYVENILKTSFKKINLETTAGIIQIDTLGNNKYNVHMTNPQISSDQDIFFCNTGVPHVVIEIPLVEKFEHYKNKAREIRNENRFAPVGTNVTLIQKTNQTNYIKAVSFERGVEDFTMACGTGAVAAGLYMKLKYSLDKTRVEMPGGNLNIDMTDTQRPIMTGPVEYLKECIYEFSI